MPDQDGSRAEKLTRITQAAACVEELQGLPQAVDCTKFPQMEPTTAALEPAQKEDRIRLLKATLELKENEQSRAVDKYQPENNRPGPFAPPDRNDRQADAGSAQGQGDPAIQERASQELRSGLANAQNSLARHGNEANGLASRASAGESESVGGVAPQRSAAPTHSPVVNKPTSSRRSLSSTEIANAAAVPGQTETPPVSIPSPRSAAATPAAGAADAPDSFSRTQADAALAHQRAAEKLVKNDDGSYLNAAKVAGHQVLSTINGLASFVGNPETWRRTGQAAKDLASDPASTFSPSNMWGATKEVLAHKKETFVKGAEATGERAAEATMNTTPTSVLMAGAGMIGTVADVTPIGTARKEALSAGRTALAEGRAVAKVEHAAAKAEALAVSVERPVVASARPPARVIDYIRAKLMKPVPGQGELTIYRGGQNRPIRAGDWVSAERDLVENIYMAGGHNGGRQGTLMTARIPAEHLYEIHPGGWVYLPPGTTGETIDKILRFKDSASNRVTMGDLLKQAAPK
ncbi:MAG: hypothetical protein HY925_10480 [Elusimicrobia bacterium]|nr:hypothetical protein [Elusimicrobiota bacterium]